MLAFTCVLSLSSSVCIPFDLSLLPTFPCLLTNLVGLESFCSSYFTIEHVVRRFMDRLLTDENEAVVCTKSRAQRSASHLRKIVMLRFLIFALGMKIEA